MAKLRSFYDVYQVGDFQSEEYIETLEFRSPQALDIYLGKLKQLTRRDYIGRLSMLLVREPEGYVHGNRRV